MEFEVLAPLNYMRIDLILGELRVPINLPSSVKDLTEDEQEFTRQSSILKAASSMLQVCILCNHEYIRRDYYTVYDR